MTVDEMIAEWIRVLVRPGQSPPCTDDLQLYTQRLWGLTDRQRIAIQDWIMDNCKYFPMPADIIEAKRALCIEYQPRDRGITADDIERWRRESVPCPPELSNIRRLTAVGKRVKRKAQEEMTSIGDVMDGKPKGAA